MTRPTRRERRKPWVLVVDDEDSICALGVRVLRHWGYQAASANSYAKGLEKALALTPDVLVVDLELKDGRGDELADRVCAELGERAPAVLICTGEERQGPGVLCKPFRAQDLVEAVAAIMRGRKPITSHRLG